MLWLGVSLLIVARARAESAEERAEQLFVQGQERMRAGHVAEACNLLEQSLRLDEALGTLINLAACHERQGRTATAFREYLTAAAWAEGRGDAEAERARFARARSRALAPSLSLLRIVVVDAPAGLTVELDGAHLGGEIGVPVPVDPGQHTLRVRARGRRPWRQDVRITAPGTTLVPVVLDYAEPKPVVRRWPLVAASAGAIVLASATGMLVRATRLGMQSRTTMREARASSEPRPLESHALELHAVGRAWQRAGYVLGTLGVIGTGVGLYGLLRASPSRSQDAGASWDLTPALGVRSAGLSLSRSLP